MSRGIVTFYINRTEYKSQDEQLELVELFKKINATVIEQIHKEGFMTMFMTTTNESSRVEKVEFS